MTDNIYVGKKCQLLIDGVHPIEKFSVGYIGVGCFFKIDENNYYDYTTDLIYPTEKSDLVRGDVYVDSTTLKKVANKQFIKNKAKTRKK